MEVIIFFVAVLIFMWPFVDLFIMSRVEHFFSEIEPELRMVYKK